MKSSFFSLCWLPFALGCSDGPGGAAPESGDCVSIRDQICERWLTTDDPDGGAPCNPPQVTANTDYRTACERADEKCSTPASAIQCSPK